MNTCSIKDCKKQSVTRGWCGMHYARWRTHGDTNIVERAHRVSSRVEQFISFGNTSCAHHGAHREWKLSDKKDSKGRIYRNLTCILCQRKIARKWNKTHPGYQDNYRYSLEGTLTRMLAQAKSRAKKYNREFNLDKQWLIKTLEQQNWTCLYTGWKFEYGEEAIDRMPSIDRVDSSVGYTTSNCEIICAAINKMKWNLNKENFIIICKQITLQKELGNAS